MRIPDIKNTTREERHLNQLAKQIQENAELTGVNVSGTQISSQAFDLVSDYEPAGDQPTAIVGLVDGVKAGKKEQLLLGVTGSGKTYTMAKVIAELGDLRSSWLITRP